MANTFIELNDVPSEYTGKALTFVRVNGREDGISFAAADIDALSDVQASGAYAPTSNQVLTYSASLNKWRPMDVDPYSAGNGLSKTGSTLQVVAAGGLTANGSGVYITEISNVEGTYGNSTSHAVFTVNNRGQIVSVSEVESNVQIANNLAADYVGNVVGTTGQIRVTGGTGNNSNAVIDLVATGVTAATYGNATHVPQITVDTYGRIQNVDLVEVVGGNISGSASNVQSFKNITVSGQTTVSAESSADTLNLVAGSGTTITTQANSDTITFGVDSSAVAGSINVGDLADVNTNGLADGQILRWSSTSGAFEAFTLVDATGISYSDLSAGTGLTYNNTTGEFKLADTTVSAGVYGGARQTPQITVDAQGRITNVSNVAMAPSGVTAGTYGNATLVPQITVDQYGAITSVTNVSSAQYVQTLSWNNTTNRLSISNSNTVDLSGLEQNLFSTIRVAGQNNIVADSSMDTLEFAAGSGIEITTDPFSDKITITNSALTSPSGVRAGTYGNATLMPQFTVDSTGRITNVSNVSLPSGLQTLSFDDSTNVLSLSDGNSVDLTSIAEKEYSFRQIRVAGQNQIVADDTRDTLNLAAGAGISIAMDSGTDTITITATGGGGSGNGNADLTSFSVVEGTPNGNGNLSYNNTTGVFTFRPADLSNVPPGYTDSDVQSYLNAQGYATQAATIAAIVDSAPATLDTLNELAAALGDDPNFATTITTQISGKADTSSLATVATTGDFGDLTNRPTMTLVGNDLTYDGTTVDLSAISGANAVGITNTVITNDELIISYSNASVQNLGNVRGAQGPQGIQGPQGDTGATGPQGPQGPKGIKGDGNAGISSATVTANNLILTLADGNTINAGNVVGPAGPQGAAGTNGTNGADGSDGVGITSVQLVGANLVLNYSNTSTQDVGNIQGPQGAQGAEGVHVSSATISSNDLIITLSNSATINAGNVQGPAGPQGATGATGAQGPAGADGADGTSISSATVNGSGNLIITLTDASTVDAGNVRGQDGVTQDLTGYATENYVNNAIASITDSDNQTLTLSGNTLSISGGNSVDLSSFAGGSTDLTGYATEVYVDNAIANVSTGGGSGTTYTGSTGITVDNTANTIALANTSVTPGTYGSTTRSPVITVDAQGRITNVTNATISGGGGGGGSVIERFKVNYTSSGAIAGTADLTSGIASVTVNSTTGGEVTIEFSGYNLPPGSIMMYGYDYTNNKYNIVPMETSMGFREIPAGGSSGSPTLFDGNDTLQVKLRLREAETGASRGGFGTTTHAWVQFVMFD